MSLQLNTTNYQSFNTNMTDLLKTGQYCGVAISLYTDEAKTTLLTKNSVTVDSLKMARINSTASYKAKSGETIKPCVDLYFSDNKEVKIVDGDDSCWYTLTGIPTPSRF